MKLNPKNQKMIEFFHQQHSDEKMEEHTKKCFRTIYEVFKRAPSPPLKVTFTRTGGENIVESSYFPKPIVDFIQSREKNQIQYEAFQDGRRIFIHFIVFGRVKKYDEYAKLMLKILFTLNHFSHDHCAKSKEFHIYIYKLSKLSNLLGTSPVDFCINVYDIFSIHHITITIAMHFQTIDPC